MRGPGRSIGRQGARESPSRSRRPRGWASAALRAKTLTLLLILHQGVQVVTGEPLAAAEERELDDEGAADDHPAETLYEAADRLHRAPRRQHVVVDEDACAAADHLGVQLERVLPVLERIGRAHGLRRKLPGPASGYESAADLVGDRRSEDEAARLRAEDEVRLLRLRPGSELLDRLPQRLRVGEERHDVPEDDALLREVRDVPDLRLQVDGHTDASCRRSRQKRSRASSCASSASSWSSSIPVFRRSGLRERSAGATTASRRPASRVAAVLKARRWRGAMPKCASRAHATATSTSPSP